MPKSFTKEECDYSHLRDTELAWLAGILDGEGSLTVKGNYPYQHIMICVKMTCLRTIVRVAELFDREDEVNIRSRSNPKHKQVYEITLCGARASGLLELVFPYLVTKQEIAVTLMDFTGSTKEKKLTLFYEAKRLNHRGVYGA